jgi:hypothetical protein
LLPNIERAFNLLLQEKLGRIEAGITVAQEIPEVTVGKIGKSYFEVFRKRSFS